MGHILITGGTGLLGQAITQLLEQKGYEVAYLSRNKEKSGNIRLYQWDIKSGFIEEGAIENASAIMHLAGASVADGRWTDARKKIIIDSRVESANLLLQKIKEVGHSPDTLVAASAIGYYGITTLDKTFTEEDSPASDFLGHVCQLWEQATSKFTEHGIRTVQIRIGVVLSNKGGALPQMAQPIKLFAGSPLGTGRQAIPWIHIHDIANMFVHALENKIEGPFNGVAPNPVDNKSFTKILAGVLKRPLFLPNVPAFVIKMMLGEQAVIALEGTKVSAKKIEHAGFVFKHPTLEPALKSIYTLQE